jgi:hypothetical protein
MPPARDPKKKMTDWKAKEGSDAQIGNLALFITGITGRGTGAGAGLG